MKPVPVAVGFWPSRNVNLGLLQASLLAAEPVDNIGGGRYRLPELLLTQYFRFCFFENFLRVQKRKVCLRLLNLFRRAEFFRHPYTTLLSFANFAWNIDRITSASGTGCMGRISSSGAS